MKTNHTTRTAVRASALTVVLAGLLLGAPATAFADTTHPTNPAPPQPCKSCRPNVPTLTGSDSEYGDASGNHPVRLTVSGWHFTPKGMVHLEAFVNGVGAPFSAADSAADNAGVVDGDMVGNVDTDPTTDPALAAPNGYVVATDVATGQQTNRLPVKVKLPMALLPKPGH
jgi:hypothetical protein